MFVSEYVLCAWGANFGPMGRFWFIAGKHTLYIILLEYIPDVLVVCIPITISQDIHETLNQLSHQSKILAKPAKSVSSLVQDC